MTKSEMKKIMKPLVKECLQEMLLQEGLLSNLISEVMKGQQRSVVTEQREQPRQQLQRLLPCNRSRYNHPTAPGMLKIIPPSNSINIDYLTCKK
mgnify:CR=1 FL=1